MTFKRLQISNWRQFRDIDVSFHERLTVLTGANGAGKTTLLNLISRHFGWQGTFVSTPRKGAKGIEFFPDYWTDESLRKYLDWLERESDEEAVPPGPPTAEGNEQPIGELTYGNGQTAVLSVPKVVSASFNVNIRPQQAEKGMHIPSHRPIFSYQSVENIPTVPRRRSQAFSSYLDIVRNRYYGGHHQRTPNYYMKETLIALAAFGPGNKVISSDAESLETFTGFEEVLSKVLPPSLGFERIAVRLPEVVLITRSGEFSLDAVSGGIASLIDLAWQIYMYEDEATPFVVTIDEPENHLHPELQRTVLSTFLEAFPSVQFVCATHNPFIVTSVPDSHTYALRYGSDSRVRSEFLSSADRSGTSNEILRDVLGLPSSSPTWVESKVREIEDDLRDRDLTSDVANELRRRLSEAGLERFAPRSLARLASDQGKK